MRIWSIGTLTRVSLVGIRLGGTLGDLKVLLADDLVESIFTAAEDLASIAVAMGLSAVYSVRCAHRGTYQRT